MKDHRFHCEDCDSYSQCQYYHNRKGTSLICKEFQYGSSVIEQIRAEIDSHCSDNRDRNDGLYIAMKIIDKYKEKSEVTK